ncbi:MAG: bifunctional metallophosphatase/5'-nucleotidase [Chloroflexi bacterium]|nr:bifunctional metallophosphatase/5'-nucleotidase [Chloroflexota bacterium]
MKLTILHTNDLHGRVPQLLRVATVIRRIRAEVESSGGHCLYLDAGDAEDTSLLESSLTKGNAMEAILRGAGCDYAALGNAIPGRYGPGAVTDLAKYFGRPLLCGNIFAPGGECLVEGLQPFAVESFGKVKVGIIGLTDPVRSYGTFFKLVAKNPAELLPGYIDEVRARGAETIILLSHLGFNNDKKIAEAVSGIDVIIGGHSHTKLDEPVLVNGTHIAQAGDFGKFIGRIDLTIDPVTGKLTTLKGFLLPITDDIPADPQAQASMEAQKTRVDEMMRLEIGILKDPIELVDDRECAAGNLLADALLERFPEAQVAFVLSGHWKTGLAESGPLTQGTLYSSNRSTANPGKVELTGLQIETFLIEALKPENAARQLHALRGSLVGMPHLAGMRARYNPSDLSSLEIYVGDEHLQKDKKYLVVSTDMEFADYINYLVIPSEEVEYEVPTIMPEVLEDYIALHSPLSAPEGGRLNSRS